MKFDELIVNYVGEFGTYQKLQFLAVCLPTIITAMHALSWTFAASPVPSRCRLLAETPNSTYWLSGTSSLLRADNTSCLSTGINSQTCYYEACTLGDSKYCPQGHLYLLEPGVFSAINRWDIVCDRHVLKAVIQSMYYVGQMVGSLVFGFLGDRIGRKKVFFIALVLQITAGLLMIFAPHWAMFAFLRAVVGAAHPGVFMIAVVIGMELAGPSKRKIASVMTGIFFSLGGILLGTVAYFLRDYRQLQAAIALPSLVFISYWWIVPESARWLISQQRFAEADAILQRVARANKTQLPPKWWEEIETSSSAPAPTTSTAKPTASSDEEKQSLQDEVGSRSSGKTQKLHQRQHNFLDLLRTSKIRRISLAIFFCWPVVSMVYYGLSMNPSFLGGNLYTNFVFGAAMEIPAVLTVFFLIDKIGRKPLLAGGFIIASTCAISNLFMGGKEMHWSISLSQYLVAKCAITATYASIYTFTPELFPTVIRNTAMGVCSMMARIGAILASFISMWLVEIFGSWVMIVPFAVLGYLAAFVLLVFLPETKGCDLWETIEELEGNTKSYELQPLQEGEKPKIG